MPLTLPADDSIGQQCAVLKVTGDNTGGTLYFAVRTTGPYAAGDGAIIRSGSGAVAAYQQSNTTGRGYQLVTGLAPDTQHYWGAVLDAGNALTGQFITAAEPVPLDGPLSQGLLV